MWTKAGRGLSNATTGYLEMVYQPVEMGKTKRWPEALFGGVTKGFVRGTQRTAVGLYEFFTFPFPGDTNYGPIIKPSFPAPPTYPSQDQLPEWGEKQARR